MAEQPDPDRRWRALRAALVIATGTLALGSCSGMLLANYTVSGMSPFYSDRAAARSAASWEPADEGDWTGNYAPAFDVASEVRDARGVTEVADWDPAR